jgi:hypothetical protein
LAQRAFAAMRALVRRSFGESFAELARPAFDAPAFAPSRPRSEAAAETALLLAMGAIIC